MKMLVLIREDSNEKTLYYFVFFLINRLIIKWKIRMIFVSRKHNSLKKWSSIISNWSNYQL